MSQPTSNSLAELLTKNPKSVLVSVAVALVAAGIGAGVSTVADFVVDEVCPVVEGVPPSGSAVPPSTSTSSDALALLELLLTSGLLVDGASQGDALATAISLVRELMPTAEPRMPTNAQTNTPSPSATAARTAAAAAPADSAAPTATAPIPTAAPTPVSPTATRPPSPTDTPTAVAPIRSGAGADPLDFDPASGDAVDQDFDELDRALGICHAADNAVDEEHRLIDLKLLEDTPPSDRPIIGPRLCESLKTLEATAEAACAGVDVEARYGTKSPTSYYYADQYCPRAW